MSEVRPLKETAFLGTRNHNSTLHTQCLRHEYSGSAAAGLQENLLIFQYACMLFYSDYAKCFEAPLGVIW